MVCYIWLSADVTHTNLYLAKFIQITAVSNKSDEQFHAFVHQTDPVSRFMFQRTGITMDTANKVGCSLNHEPVRIVCHGGWNHLFLIFALAVERTFGNDYLRDLVYIITASYIAFAKILAATGCKQTALLVVCQHAAIPVERPVNAVGNVRAMKKLCMTYYCFKI